MQPQVQRRPDGTFRLILQGYELKDSPTPAQVLHWLAQEFAAHMEALENLNSDNADLVAPRFASMPAEQINKAANYLRCEINDVWANCPSFYS